MSLVSQMRERVRAMLFRHSTDAELDEEMRDHIERDVAERVRRGADPIAARRAALVAFGGVAQRKEDVRDARGIGPLEHAIADVRFAARVLRRDPIFTVAVVGVLALGIGATSAVFGVADAVLFAKLPYREADRIVRLYQVYTEQNTFGLSVVDIQAIAAQQRSFEAFGAMRLGLATFGAGSNAPEQRGLGRVTSGFFTVLGLTPVAGRLVQPSDEEPGAPPVLVLSFAQAQHWFGNAAAAVGKSVSVDGAPFTVIGVLPDTVTEVAGMKTQLWLAMQRTTPPRRGPFGIRAFGRLVPGATIASAARDLGSISERIFPIWKSSYRDSTARFTPVLLRDAILGRTAARQVGLLAAGVSLVLLVAVANVAMLLLVRISAREPELAVRGALGAGRWRMARLLAAESVLLAVFASLLGFALAVALLRAAPTLMPSLPRIAYAGANARVVLVAIGTAFVAATLATISPVLSVLARPVTASIADRRTGAGRRAERGRNLLVAAEFGLALPLLFGAGLLLNSFLRLQRVNPGYDPDAAVAVSIGLPRARYSDPVLDLRFWQQIEARVAESPAFASAGISTTIPPTEPDDINNFDLKDKPVSPGGSEHVAPWVVATNAYFDALKIPLIEGRLFTPVDTGGPFPVVVVSQSWAKTYYPEGGVIGKQMISGGCTTCPLVTVVGVVGDVKYQGLAASSDAVYEPVLQSVPSNANVVARVRGGRATPAAFAALRNIVSSIDPQLALVEVTLRDEVDGALADPRHWASILGAFAVATVLLAAVGIFGLMAYAVRTRRREIGVRMALGAQPGAVVRMIVARGMTWAAAGSAAGVAIALAGSRWLRTFLYEVGSADPLTLVAVTATLLVAAALACWFAARRAGRIHPVEAIASN